MWFFTLCFVYAFVSVVLSFFLSLCVSFLMYLCIMYLCSYKFMHLCIHLFILCRVVRYLNIFFYWMGANTFHVPIKRYHYSSFFTLIYALCVMYVHIFDWLHFFLMLLMFFSNFFYCMIFATDVWNFRGLITNKTAYWEWLRSAHWKRTASFS